MDISDIKSYRPKRRARREPRATRRPERARTRKPRLIRKQEARKQAAKRSKEVE